jgi:hypothetical protein
LLLSFFVLPDNNIVGNLHKGDLILKWKMILPLIG